MSQVGLSLKNLTHLTRIIGNFESLPFHIITTLSLVMQQHRGLSWKLHGSGFFHQTLLLSKNMWLEADVEQSLPGQQPSCLLGACSVYFCFVCFIALFRRWGRERASTFFYLSHRWSKFNVERGWNEAIRSGKAIEWRKMRTWKDFSTFDILFFHSAELNVKIFQLKTQLLMSSRINSRRFENFFVQISLINSIISDVFVRCLRRHLLLRAIERDS